MRHLHLQYLYVDRRFAGELPRLGSYFYKGETPGPQRLTRAELTKFDNVTGLHAVYRHGPIVIYDTSGLGVKKVPAIWYGETHPMRHPRTASDRPSGRPRASGSGAYPGTRFRHR